MNNTSTLEKKYVSWMILFSIMSILVLVFSMQPIKLYLLGVRTNWVVEKIETHNSRCRWWHEWKIIHIWYDCTIYSATIVLSGSQTSLAREIQSYNEKYGSSALDTISIERPTYFLYNSSSTSWHDQSVALSVYHEGQEVELIVDPEVIDNSLITNNIATKENLIRWIILSLGVLWISISFFIFFLVKWMSSKKS